MPDASLTAVVGADVQGYVSGMKQAEAASQDLLASVKKVEERFQFQNTALNQSSGYMRQQAERAKELAAAEREVSSATTSAATGIEKVGKSAGGVIENFNSAYAAVRKLAYILPGIGVAGLFNLAFEGIQEIVKNVLELNSGFDKQASETKKADEAAKSLLKTLTELKSSQEIEGQASGSQAGNIERVQALAAAVRDTNLSYAERKRALEELKETNKSYFGDLTLEKSSLEILSKRVQEYSAALIQEAIIKGYSEEISKTTIEYNKQVGALEKLKTALSNARTEQAKAGPVDVGGVGGGSSTGVTSQNQSAIIAADKVDATNKAFIKQRDLVEYLKSSIAAYNGEIETAVDAQLKLRPLQEAKDDSKTKTVRDENLAYLNKTIQLVEDLNKASDEPLFKLFQKSAEGGLGELNLQRYKDELAKATEDAAKGAITPDTFSKYAAALKDSFDKAANPNLKVRLNFAVDDRDNGDKDPGKILDRLFRKAEPKAYIHLIINGFDQDKVKEIYDQAKGIADKINKILENGIKSGIINLADAIGGAIGSGQDVLGAAIGSLLEFLGTGIQEIGKQLIVIGSIAAVAATAIKTLLANPGLSIIAGAALIAVGAVLKAKASNIHAFAEGGIVTGPTLGLVGEAGPEVIFPLNQLNKFMKGNTGPSNMQLQGETRIKGSDLVVALARANKNNNLSQ